MSPTSRERGRRGSSAPPSISAAAVLSSANTNLLATVGRAFREEVDAFLFAKPRDERERALLVLDLVLVLRIGAGKAEVDGVGRDVVFLKHLADDVLHVQVLEDLAVRGVRKQRDLGHHAEVVLPHRDRAVSGVARGHRCRFDDAPEHALRVRRVGMDQLRLRPDQLLDRDVVLGEHADDQERGHAQLLARVDRHHTFGLEVLADESDD